MNIAMEKTNKQGELKEEKEMFGKSYETDPVVSSAMWWILGEVVEVGSVNCQNEHFLNSFLRTCGDETDVRWLPPPLTKVANRSYSSSRPKHRW